MQGIPAIRERWASNCLKLFLSSFLGGGVPGVAASISSFLGQDWRSQERSNIQFEFRSEDNQDEGRVKRDRIYNSNFDLETAKMKAA
ncbi:hypothetical protein V501_01747 [Pseudogymnoascus sp. VKM F-4519 (FW-2642)]|nr:hypothetical protein V501_01747 [Pseudogymnoascus sp. VKM F-4519 (FW-2642)]